MAKVIARIGADSELHLPSPTILTDQRRAEMSQAIAEYTSDKMAAGTTDERGMVLVAFDGQGPAIGSYALEMARNTEVQEEIK